ncbi:MAG TPA: GIY-YIG nuclease family protein [Terriglobales bacterium]|nr:GIY-YIG nuclease family protein [Terriglobales bacterium]
MHSREARSYYVYILTNRSKTLYTGVTSNLEQRMWQHKHHVFPGFTADYKIDRLVYFERYSSVHSAIAREKQIKGYTRLKKIALIVGQNPTLNDLSETWYAKHRYEPDREARNA